jgi:dTDP-4-dehydrorhamnose 3,5-epimerase-like enzyme
MIAKIKVVELPITDRRIPVRRIIQDKGELTFIEDGMTIRHLGYFSLKSGPGFYRGNHYHLWKVEHLYLISGALRISAADVETGERATLIVDSGCRVTLYPQCAHRYEAESDIQVIEYCDTVYDPRDDIPYTQF